MGTGASGGPAGEDLVTLEHAIATLEAQREVLGDVVVETALAPLQQRRRSLLEQERGEQRRLVTVVFADLVGFTELSSWLDAEDTRNIVDAYFSRWLRVIEDHDGEVEKFIGDAVMAVFGLRHSWEDDAQRAVRAALAMVADLEHLNVDLQQRYGVRLQMRIGVDTGDVVVSTLGDRGGASFVVVGQTVNRASRLQSAAPADGVLISADTHRQVRGRFSMRRLAPLVLKGIDEPVEVFRVLSERPNSFRLDRIGGVEGVSTSTVGRERELRLLQDLVVEVERERHPRLVTVVGDAGVGKSRLLLDFDSWLAERAEPVWWFRGRAAHSARHHANALLRDMVASRCSIAESDPPEQVRAKLEAGFGAATGDPAEAERTARLVGAWLRLDPGAPADREARSGAEVPVDPQALRYQAGEALGRFLATLSERAPVVVLLEDLHWADDGSLGWLDDVHPFLAATRVLVVATARPSLLEERPGWGDGLEHHVRLPLGALSREESRLLVDQLLHRVDERPPRLVDLVVESADGNPYYLEELVSWLVESGVIVKDGSRWLVREELVGVAEVPSTLRGLLQARLDGLSAVERGLLQRASVIGRVFWDLAVAELADVSSAAGGRDGTTGALATVTEVTLEALRHRDLVLQRDSSAFEAAREFSFRHALLRDVAYDSVLRARRQRYHALVAHWLTETSRRSGREGEFAALVAEHHDRAGDAQAAGPWYFLAGRQALSVYALAEARHLLGRALDLVTRDPVMRFDILAAREEVLDRLGERDTQQLDLTEMGELLDRIGDDPERTVRHRLASARWGFALSDYEETETRAEQAVDIAAVAGLPEAEAQARLWLGKALTWRDETDAALAVLTAAKQQGEALGRPLVTAEALRYLSMLANNEGRYPESLRHVDEARSLFAAAGDLEGEGTAIGQRATTLYNLGRLAEARRTLEELVPLFRRSGHRYREALVASNIAAIALAQGELAEATRWSRLSVAEMRRLADQEALTNCLLVSGLIATAVGDYEQAERDLREAVALSRDVESRTIECDSLRAAALVELERGDPAAALRMAEEAVAVGEFATSDMERGLAHLSLGYACSATGALGRAQVAFAEAEQLFDGLDATVLSREARTGRAGVVAAAGRAAEAAGLVEDVLEHLDLAALEGALRLGAVLLTCCEVLHAAGHPRAEEVLGVARSTIHDAAERIGDEAMARRFLGTPLVARVLAWPGTPPDAEDGWAQEPATPPPG